MEYGTKETKEILAAGFALSKVLIEVLKDGYQGSDIPTLISKILLDRAFTDKVLLAYEDAGLVMDEVKDLDMDEGFELAEYTLAETKEIVKLLKA